MFLLERCKKIQKLMEIPVSKLDILQKAFLERGETLSLAESMTGGRFSSWLVHLPRASEYFEGGVISYGEDVKIKLLKVNSKTIQKYGVVSQETAQEMAQGVRNLLKTDWSFAITGFAGSNSEKSESETGKVAFALGSPHALKSETAYFKSLSREKIQYEATLFALDFLISELK